MAKNCKNCYWFQAQTPSMDAECFLKSIQVLGTQKCDEWLDIEEAADIADGYEGESHDWIFRSEDETTCRNCSCCGNKMFALTDDIELCSICDEDLIDQIPGNGHNHNENDYDNEPITDTKLCLDCSDDCLKMEMKWENGEWHCPHCNPTDSQLADIEANIKEFLKRNP